jgi:ABC-type transport system involved in multi-copper enzyme maturation permease subunit
MTRTLTQPVIDYSTPGATGSIWTQTWGLAVDAYRELHAKKLFWITLLLSLLVVVAFAFVGINEVGVTIFTWELPGVWNTNVIPRESFYKFLFVSLAIPIWLGIAASVLALISVGGIFPDMITGGSIDLYLSKPISRLRLFLTKYLFGLTFVALQVLVFCTASFFVMGLRGSTWEPGVFLAVPIVTVFFSYLFCICVLLGILTRSTLVSILLTLLVWFGLWMFNSADGGLLTFKAAAQQRVFDTRRMVQVNEQLIARNEALPEGKRGNMSQFEFQLAQQRQRLAEAEDTANKLTFWHNLILYIKAPLPKTSETIELMNRWLVNMDPFMEANEQSHSQQQARRAQRRGTTTTAPTTQEVDRFDRYLEMPETQKQIQEEIRGRSLAWVIGTSLGFEAFILALAAWVFCRRDF